jgi:hypothetical protein
MGLLPTRPPVSAEAGWLCLRLEGQLDGVLGCHPSPPRTCAALGLARGGQPWRPTKPFRPGRPPPRPVSRPGDVWLLGDHRIMCGDARDLAVYRQLVGHEKADLVFTDPPYNVPISEHVCGSGAVQHREWRSWQTRSRTARGGVILCSTPSRAQAPRSSRPRRQGDVPARLNTTRPMSMSRCAAGRTTRASRPSTRSSAFPSMIRLTDPGGLGRKC